MPCQEGADRGTESEAVRAKYAIGCDGAELDSAPARAGASGRDDRLDLRPSGYHAFTDFLTIRLQCAIPSADNGSLMLILREEKLVRPHIQLKEVMSDTNGTTDKAEINPETVSGAL